MYTTSFIKKMLFVAISIVLFTSCDKDYNTIGNDLIGDYNYDLVKDSLFTVEASSRKTGAIASNNLDVNSLGILDNTAFGETIANFATQVQLEKTNPTIDVNLGQKVESVTLYIPYFSNKISTNTNGTSNYTLDSIYGSKSSKIKLSIYANKYLLGNLNTEGVPAPALDPNYPQLYFTDQNSFFDSSKKGQLLNDSSDSAQNNAFDFSVKEHKVETSVSGSTAVTTSYLAPGMRLDLNKAFFQKLLFDKSSQGYSLASNPEFEQYFKGLYFSVEKADVLGVLARMNFKKGTIVVKYKEKTSLTDAALIDKSITLNLTGNTVNLLKNIPSTGTGSYSNPTSGNLYLRGGEGSVATIDLFNPNVDVVTYNRTTKKIESGSNKIPDELDYIKEKGWLINDASLTFYVDQNLMVGVTEPSKIFLYDINNQQIFSVGVIEKDVSGRGLKYKVGITDYVRGIVNNDFTNVKLGVSVAHSGTNVKFKKSKDAPPYTQWQQLLSVEKNAYFFPESSVISPLGTILYGTHPSVPEDKKIKLQIYYTKPN